MNSPACKKYCQDPARCLRTPWHCGLFDTNGGHKVSDSGDMPIHYLGPEEEDEFARSLKRDIWITVGLIALIVALYGASRWWFA